MATQITASLPALNFPKEVDYPTQEDWAAFSAAAEENFGILGGSWSTQMQLWKTEANAMSNELNNNSNIAQSVANYQGDWVSQGYTLGQTVSANGIYYVCKLTHATGQNPTAGGSLYWNLALGNWNLKVNTDMSGYTSKTTPIDDDFLPLSDSASAFGIKKLSWANLKATLKTYFDTLYVALTGDQTIYGIKSFIKGILTPNISYKNTPVNITSWSYSTTTITLNVTSHTFLIGDYIEVSGLTSTTYPANGIFLVTSVTPTTIVFTQAVGPTGTTGVSSATVKGYTTINGRVSESIGVNQTWQNVTASRASSVTYTNTSGKPIVVNIISDSTSVASLIQININGVLMAAQGSSAVSVSRGTSVIIPDGSTYSVILTNGTLYKWSELR